MNNDNDYIAQDAEEEHYVPQRKPRGCMFYGCLSAIVVSIIAVVLIGIGGFMLVRAFRTFVDKFGEDIPQPIAVSMLPEAEVKALQARVTTFQQAIVAQKETVPLELTAEEINAIIDANPDFKGVISVNFEGNKFRGDVAFPLEKVGFPGKYINGKATFDVRMDGGLLLITIDQLEVKGKPVDEETMVQLRLQNLAKDSANDAENAKIIAQLEKIEIKDGKLIITPRKLPKIKPADDQPIENQAEPEAKPTELKPDSKPAETKPTELKPDSKPAEPKPKEPVQPAKKAA